jgi:hypothetical protein
MDLKLTVNNDLDVEDGDLVFISGTEAIAQHLLIRLRTFKGEWFRDLNIGMPYLIRSGSEILDSPAAILKKNPNIAIVQTRFRQAILTTPGVIELTVFNYEWDKATRVFTLNFRALTTEGPLDFSEEFILT